MLSICCVGVYGCQPENPSVCFGMKPLTRPEVGEGRKVREKTEEVSQQKGAEEISRLERAVKRRRTTQLTEVSMVSGFCGSFV